MNDFRIRHEYDVKVNNVIQALWNLTDIGLIQDITTTISPSTTSVGMPSQPSQNSFVFDYGVLKSYTFSFRRVSPANPVDEMGNMVGGVWQPADSTKWSNGFWIYVMKHYIVNRWQTETDGCKIQYISPDESCYPTIQPINTYVRSFSAKQSSGDTQTLTGTISFRIGGTSEVKEVAKHVIVYDANYKAYAGVSGVSDEVNDDISNFVNVTNSDYTNTMDVAGTWLSNAQTYGIYQPGDNLTDMKTLFRWNTASDGSGTDYTLGQLVNPLPEGTLTLYARYNRS